MRRSKMLSFLTLHAELKQVPGMDKNRFSSSLLAMSMLRIGPTPKRKPNANLKGC